MCVAWPLQLCVHRHNCMLISCQLLSGLSCKVIEKIFAHEDDTQLIIFLKSPCNPNIVNIHVRNKISLLNVFQLAQKSCVGICCEWEVGCSPRQFGSNYTEDEPTSLWTVLPSLQVQLFSPLKVCS